MEEARHWVWAKRKHGLISTNNSHDLHHHMPTKSSYDDSWEEQAFAEDAAGPLGGCIWPPRSYSCSFCRREFRSAQALGGHMNVHRRDRARLKQSPPDLHREILHQNSHDHLSNNVNNPFHQNIVSPLMITTSLGGSSTASKIPQFPSQVCALVYNPNPNSYNHDPNHDLVSSSTPQPCEQINCHHEKQVLFPHHSSSSSFILQENNDKESNNRNLVFNPSSWSNLGTTDRCYHHKSYQKDVRGDQKVSSLTAESGGLCRAKSRDYHHVKTDLSVSLNLVVCHSCPSTLSGGDSSKEDCDHGHTVSTCKRRRIVYEEEPYSSQLPPDDNLIRKPSSGDQLSVPNVEKLDLELRLGVRTSPKVKY